MSTPASPPPEIPYSALLGQVIKQRRTSQGVDQVDMASALGVSQSAYSRIESGDTTMNVWQLRTCAELLDVSPSRLLEQVQRHEHQLSSQGVKVVAEKRTNPAAALIGIAILAALLAR